MELQLRQRIRFFGWVQGVGFRYRAHYAAQAAGATGWVRNEADGSVLMEIQGTQVQIDAVIQAVERGTYVRIEAMEVRSLPLDPTESDFLELE